MEFFLELIKAENPEAYKKLAEKGIMVGFPAKVMGQEARPDIGIPYHSTVKFFNPEKDQPSDIHGIASKLQLTPPDPKKTKIEPSMFKDRLGNDVYVIKLHGDHADEIKAHNKNFSHMGFPANFEYQPHVSVDKATWQKIVDSKAKTAHEAGIEFGPAQLRQGHTVLATYPHATRKPKEDKLAASEQITEELLEKGAIKNLGTALGAAAAMTVATPSLSNAPTNVPATHIQQAQKYSSRDMLRTIAQVESSNGKQMDHHALGGMHHGEKAYGKYGLTPNTIRDTIALHPDMKTKYKKAMMLHGQDLHRFMDDHPGLEDQVAGLHLTRLEHHFGQDPSALGYAWLEGIRGTYRAQKEHQDIKSHWHVRKINDAYGKVN